MSSMKMNGRTTTIATFFFCDFKKKLNKNQNYELFAIFKLIFVINNAGCTLSVVFSWSMIYTRSMSCLLCNCNGCNQVALSFRFLFVFLHLYRMSNRFSLLFLTSFCCSNKRSLNKYFFLVKKGTKTHEKYFNYLHPFLDRKSFPYFGVVDSMVDQLQVNFRYQFLGTVM